MRYFFFPGKRRRRIARPEYVSLAVRSVYFNDAAADNAICNSPRCDADLPRLQRTDAGRPTRIIAKSRTQAAPARPSVRFTRAPLLSSIIYFPPSPLLENVAEIYRASITIEYVASRLRDAKL